MPSPCAPRAFRAAPVLLGMLALAPAVHAGELFGFRPGHVYAPMGSGIREYTPDLQYVATLQVPGMDLASGCVFNAAGNLVLVGRPNTGSALMEVSAAGEIVRQHHLASGFLGGSYVEVDASGRYIVANDSVVSLFSPTFEPLGTLPFDFIRASGVTIGPTGDIYATDSAANVRARFSAAGSLLAVVETGLGSTGMDFGPDGFIYQAAFGGRRVDRAHRITGVWTTLYSTHPDSPADIEFLPDGSYYLSVHGNRIEHRSAGHAVIGSVEITEYFDCVAVYVPGPSVGAVLILGGLAACRRRRA